jgi:hypothetical protein
MLQNWSLEGGMERELTYWLLLSFVSCRSRLSHRQLSPALVRCTAQPLGKSHHTGQATIRGQSSFFLSFLCWQQWSLNSGPHASVSLQSQWPRSLRGLWPVKSCHMLWFGYEVTARDSAIEGFIPDAAVFGGGTLRGD